VDGFRAILAAGKEYGLAETEGKARLEVHATAGTDVLAFVAGNAFTAGSEVGHDKLRFADLGRMRSTTPPMNSPSSILCGS